MIPQRLPKGLLDQAATYLAALTVTETERAKAIASSSVREDLDSEMRRRHAEEQHEATMKILAERAPPPALQPPLQGVPRGRQ